MATVDLKCELTTFVYQREETYHSAVDVAPHDGGTPREGERLVEVKGGSHQHPVALAAGSAKAESKLRAQAQQQYVEVLAAARTVVEAQNKAVAAISGQQLDEFRLLLAAGYSLQQLAGLTGLPAAAIDAALNR